MVMSVYLGHADQALVNRAIKSPNKIKKSKVMNVSFELLWDWVRKVMNSDEGFFKRLDKRWGFGFWHGNVTISNQRIKKVVLSGLFFICF